MAGERTQFFTLGAATETTFKTVNGSGGFTNVQAFNLSSDYRRETMDDQTARIHRGTNAPIIGTKYNSTLGFSTYFPGLEASGTGSISSATALGPLFHSAVGHQVLGTGTEINGSAAGSANAPHTVADIADGSIVGFKVGSAVEWRFVRSDAGADADCNISYGLSATPSTGAVVHGTAHYKLGMNSSGNYDDKIPKTVQFQHLNESSDRKYQSYGCTGSSLSLDRVTPGQVPTLSWNYSIGTYDDSITTSMTAPGTLFTKKPWMDSEVLIWPYSSSTVTYNAAAHKRALRGLNITINNNPVWDPDPSDADGLSGWTYGPDNACTIQFSLNVDDAWSNDFADGQDYGMMFTFGRTAQNTSGIYIDRAVITQEPTTGDDNGMMTTEVSMALHPEPDANGAVVFFQG